MSKYLKVIIVSVIAIAVLLGLNLYDGGIKNLKAGLLTIAFLDVGQGDSILIRTPQEKNILIDGGPDNSVVFELDKIVPSYDREIDAMILTHPHADHVDGLVDVLKDYKVDEIYYTGVSHTAPDYIEWLKEVREKNIPINIVKKALTLNLEPDLNLEFLYPFDHDFTNEVIDDLNNSSIVNKLIYKNTKFLFTGDAAEAEESEILQSGQDISADVLKVGHHGSKTSTSDAFLKAINPVYAIISVGLGNSFGHPHYRTLSKLNDLGAKVLRTDEKGTIIMQSDGEKITVIN